MVAESDDDMVDEGSTRRDNSAAARRHFSIIVPTATSRRHCRIKTNLLDVLLGTYKWCLRQLRQELKIVRTEGVKEKEIRRTRYVRIFQLILSECWKGK